MLNTLARLGWSKGDNEVFYLENLIQDFEITEVQKAGAIFDVSKLDYLNAQHMANLSLEDFKEVLTPFLTNIDIDINSHTKLDHLIKSMRSSANTLSEVATNLKCYYQDIESYNQKAIEKFIGNSSKVLTDIHTLINNLDDWNEEALDNLLLNYRHQNELSVPKVNQPIRIALTGSTNSPSLGLTLYLFEKEEVLKRIESLIEIVEKEN